MSHVAGMPAWKFGYYLNSKHGQRGILEQHVEEMMIAVGAPLDLDKYNAKHFMPKVIDKWNNDYAGRFKFKCFIFSSLGRYKPILKHGLDDYNVPILLYRIDEHFHGVHKTCQLFGKPYCLSCEHCYNRPKTHSATCKARCIKWYGLGNKKFLWIKLLVLVWVLDIRANHRRVTKSIARDVAKLSWQRTVIDRTCNQDFATRVSSAIIVTSFMM